MFEIIKSVILEVTGKKELYPDTDFIKDLKLSSFDIVNIIAKFEERFAIEIKTRELWSIHTVKDLIDYLESMGISA